MSSPDTPLISVMMSVYNAERYVAEAIQSILGQTEGRFEFLIVNDGSRDASSDEPSAVARLCSLVHNLGVCHAQA